MMEVLFSKALNLTAKTRMWRFKVEPDEEMSVMAFFLMHSGTSVVLVLRYLRLLLNMRLEIFYLSH